MTLNIVQRMLGQKISRDQDLMSLNLVKRPELFGERCEVCGHSMLYADNMSIVIKTTRKTAIRTAIKIDFLISELGKILQSNGLMLNVDKTETLRTLTRQQLAANGEERLILQTVDKRGERIRPKV